jgi:hypothetical protein
MPENTSTTPLRDEKGRFIKSATGITYSTSPTSKSESDAQISTYNITKQRTDPPLLFLRISNPVTYIKRWWKRLIGNEGLELRLRVKPLTAITIAVALGLFGFGVGRVSVPANSPIIKYIPQLAALPTANPWRETAFSGTLRSTNGNIYLFTTESEALTLKVPSNLSLSNYVGKRILAKGLYNENQRLLNIVKAEDVELLNIKPLKIPTIVPPPDQRPSGPAASPTSKPIPIPTEELIQDSIFNNPSM